MGDDLGLLGPNQDSLNFDFVPPDGIQEVLSALKALEAPFCFLGIAESLCGVNLLVRCLCGTVN